MASEETTAATPTIGEIVARDYRAAAVFDRFGIDFCCGGNRRLTEVCAERGLDPALVLEQLGHLEAEGPSAAPRFDRWELDFLIEYIVANHHAYVRAALPRLAAYTEKVAAVHGERHPELREIRHRFAQLRHELEFHMAKEEEILFPHVRAMVDAHRFGRPGPDSPFGTIENPIAVMEEEHRAAGDAMDAIRALSGDYTPPEDGCNTLGTCYGELRDFERDLHEHVHLENNLLFPKAVRLQQELASGRPVAR